MSSKRTREWLVERAALGELDGARANAELTPEEQARIEELRAENEAILGTYPPASVAEEIRRRSRVAEVQAAEARRRARRSAVLIAAPAAAAALFLAIAVVPRSGGPIDDPEIVRIKGDRKLSIHRKTEQRSEILREGDEARRGDLLQLGYGAGDGRFGLVLSIDGGGAVTLHLPQRAEESSVELERGGAELPFSYELDAAPQFERFFLISAAELFSAEVVLAAAQKLAADRDRAKTDPLLLPSSFAQTSVLLRKANTP